MILTPSKPHFYVVKLGFTGVYIVILISASILSRDVKNIRIFYLNILIFFIYLFTYFFFFFFFFFFLVFVLFCFFFVVKFSIYLNRHVFIRGPENINYIIVKYDEVQ